MRKIPYLSKEKIKEGISTIAKKLNRTYPVSLDADPPIVLIILRGAFIFGADLVRELKFDHQISFVKASSYIDNVKVGMPEIAGGDLSFFARDIIIVEDIVDSGDTMEALQQWCMAKGANTISMVTILQKQSANVIATHYIHMMEDESVFVYGYGLDNDTLDRHLKDIYTL